MSIYKLINFEIKSEPNPIKLKARSFSKQTVLSLLEPVQ